MTKSDKVLVILFRYLLGIGGLFALVPVLMPVSWMAVTHRWLGLGEMPTGPIVEYLARSLSAFYALVGALCLMMSSDLDCYRSLVRFFGVCIALLGIVFTGVDLATGMHWWWTALEGPGPCLLGHWCIISPGPFTELAHDCGSLISIPYLGATTSSFSISSFVGGSAVVEPSGSGTPISKNILSRPAGATEISILAGLSLSFLKEWGVPTGMLANIPAVATTRSPLIVNVISPSRM
jgi:hypothetical protein